MCFGDLQYLSSVNLKIYFIYFNKICHTIKSNLYQVVQCSVILIYLLVKCWPFPQTLKILICKLKIKFKFVIPVEFIAIKKLLGYI